MAVGVVKVVARDTVATPTPEQKTITNLQSRLSDLQGKYTDFAQLRRYQSANTALPSSEKHRVVFYGDSITDLWIRSRADFFGAHQNFVDRGISGQTTPQMLLRFQQDVVALHPEAVIILAGTNDIAGNTGPSTLEMIEDNFRSMTAIAKANHIRVILASVLPAFDFPWRKGLAPAPTIIKLNQWLADYCNSEHITYLDYYTSMAAPNGGMKDGLSKDGVHPTPEGYAIMEPLALQALKK
jgi:lysophospholipase L1-like esterase